MDNFDYENRTPENPQPQEPVAPVQPAEPPARENYSYRGTGAGRRESPYADSPYVMNHRPDSQYRYQPRQEPGRYQTQYEVPRKPARKTSSGVWKKVAAALAAVALVAGSCAITAGLVNSHWEKRTEELEKELEGKLIAVQAQIEAQAPAATGNSVSGTVSSQGGLTAGQVYAQNVHSVVLIESTITTSMYGQTATGMSSGSGFILTEDGYVVTNYHVVEGASSVAVVRYDGTRHQAEVIGYDDTNDVAVLKVDASGLQAVKVGSSDALIVGDQVVAIGNPLGELTSTLTVGYVSAKERDVTTDGTVINMLQTDCAINSGNSGGPLFNMYGEVVGITTAKYSGASSSGASIEGIGFAIPINDVLEGISDLMEYGFIKSAYMGVVVRNMDPSVAEIYGLPLGPQVTSVEENGAAARAGIQEKDIILQVDDVRIETLTALTKALRGYEPGDEVTVTIYRNGAEREVRMILDERPRDLDVVAPESGTQSEMPDGDFDEWFEYFAPFFGQGGNGG